MIAETNIPKDEAVERALLGACVSYSECIADLADMLRPAMFSSPAHVEIWTSLSMMYARRVPIDTITLIMDLKRRDRLEMVGGPVYLSQLMSVVSSTKHAVHHAAIIAQLYIKREAMMLGHRLHNLASNPASDPFDILASVSSEIRLLNEFGGSHPRNMAEVVTDVVDDNSPDRGIGFGFAAIEEKQVRLEPGTVTIIGARPAMGKTAFMLSCAWRQAQAGHRPYIAELEMKDRNLGRRLVCGEAGVPVWKSKRKCLSQQDIDTMARWRGDNGDALSRVLVDEASTMTVSTLAAKLDRAKRKDGIDMVWIDYIGLLQPSTKQRPGYDRMTAISNELRVLAKDLDLPFAVLAQLSRPPKGVAVKAPALTDLRDSGEIEQDAEAVVFLHRPKYYDMNADDTVDVIIAKNRDGGDGVAHLLFDGPGTRMLDAQTSFPAFRPELPRDFTQPAHRTDESPF
jgi:replicative DNA helicase